MPDLRTTVLTQLGANKAENPLRTIAFNKEMLNLGLSEDELYGFCLRQARHLFGVFHEDIKTKTPQSERLEDMYSQAFAALKKRELFHEYLREFSQERAEDRREEILLRTSLESERTISAGLRTEVATLREMTEAKTTIQRNFSRYLKVSVSNPQFEVEKGKWSKVAPLWEEGEIAVIRIVSGARKKGRVYAEVPGELAQDFKEGCEALRKINLLNSGNHPVFEINKISNGAMDKGTEKELRMAGCVDIKNKKIARTTTLLTQTLTNFNETQLLSSIQCLLFFPGIIVMPLTMARYKYNTGRLLPSSILKNLGDKATRPASRSGQNSGVTFSPLYLFLGFRRK